MFSTKAGGKHGHGSLLFDFSPSAFGNLGTIPILFLGTNLSPYRVSDVKALELSRKHLNKMKPGKFCQDSSTENV